MKSILRFLGADRFNPGKLSQFASMMLLAVALLASSVQTTYAQSGSITVTVMDADGKTPLPGAVVAVADNPNKASVTDYDGVATLTGLASTDQIFVSYIGMENQTFTVGSQSTLKVTMAADSESLAIESLVVVGYGTQRKENLTGAVSSVKMDEVLGDRPVVSASSALQGSVPGLSITGSNEPGTNLNFNIRGTNSINGGSPLILIDGVEGDLDMVNPNDIESVSVLKDASSAAIYGARAAFGVVLVNTKGAKKNSKAKINYNNNFSFSVATNIPEQVGIVDALKAQNAADSDGISPLQAQTYSDWIDYATYYQENGKDAFLEKYDGWFRDGAFIPESEMIYYWLQDNDHVGNTYETGFQQTHNVSVSGGSDKISYRVSGGYISNDGPLTTDKDSYERVNIQSFVDAEITDWLSTALTISYARSDKSKMMGSLYGYTVNYTPAGYFATSDNPDEGTIYPAGTAEHHAMYNDPQKTRTETPRITSKTTISPFEGFQAVVDYTYESSEKGYQYYENNWKYYDQQNSIKDRVVTPNYTARERTDRYNSLNIYGTYEKSTNDQKHNFKLMAGFAQETESAYFVQVKREGVIDDENPSLNTSTGTIYTQDHMDDYAIRSGYFRFNYNYENKYLLELNGRYDGSSKFPTDTRFGFFPSVSAGWQLANEPFMDWSDNWLDQFKVRASWGQIGNQAIDNYGYFSFMEPEYANWISGGVTPVTVGSANMVRSNYTWETVQTLDVGFDMNMLDNRLNTIFSWYQRDTKDMLAPGMELPAVVGASAPLQNVADLRSKGWELSITWNDRIGNWRYGAGFNIYDQTTKITKYDNAAGIIGYGNNNIYYEGQTMGEIWGYETAGFYETSDFKPGWENGTWVLKDGVTSIEGQTPIAGDVKYVNLMDDDGSTNMIDEGEGTLDNPGDQKIIGDKTAHYQFGLNANVGWKGWDLSLFFTGTMKRDAWVNGNLIFPMNSGNWSTLWNDQAGTYWTPDENYNNTNPNAFYPAFDHFDNRSKANKWTQTKYLSNAAYIRLKNLTLSYTVPAHVISKIGLSNAKVFFSGENLFTLDHLPKGIDPQTLGYGYPFYAVYSFGINLTL